MPRESGIMNSEQAKTRRIWAIGGGKGGTGKSFLSASLGIEIGWRDGDIVLVDADFGGPNLATLLGIRDVDRDLGSFFRNDFSRLEDVLLDTPYPGLRLIKGTESALFSANLHHSKKLKLIRQLKNLGASRVILDLGTGSSYNTLDLFILGQPGILVLTPEPTAIENGYYFLRACAARIVRLYSKFHRTPELASQLTHELENGSLSLRACLERLTSLDHGYGPTLLAVLKNFRLGLVINKARSEKDYFLAESIADVVRKYFFFQLDPLATIPYDEKVHWSLKKFKPFLHEHPESEVSQAIRKIAQKLTEGEPESSGRHAVGPLN